MMMVSKVQIMHQAYNESQATCVHVDVQLMCKYQAFHYSVDTNQQNATGYPLGLLHLDAIATAVMVQPHVFGDFAPTRTCFAELNVCKACQADLRKCITACLVLCVLETVSI